jgi:nucleoporin SEH1
MLGQAHEHAIVNVVWLPWEYGDAIACVCSDGALSLWEEVAAG